VRPRDHTAVDVRTWPYGLEPQAISDYRLGTIG
jgi:hypothetical protein